MKYWKTSINANKSIGNFASGLEQSAATLFFSVMDISQFTTNRALLLIRLSPTSWTADFKFGKKKKHNLK